MEILEGKKIFLGTAIGKIHFYSKKESTIERYRIDDPEKEWKRFEEAKEQAIQEISELYQKALKEVGELNAEIFEIHAMMLEDEDYLDSIKNMVFSQNVNAEYAVGITGDNFSKMFADMEDEYFKARSADVKDISERVITVLNGSGKEHGLGKEPVILVADDLAPSETVQLDKSKLLAFFTRHGSANSHTAILARTMNIPSLAGVNISPEWDGKIGIVDGKNGRFIVEPDQSVLEKYQKIIKQEQENKALLTTLKGKETITMGGRKIKLYANMGNASDLGAVLQNDAEGIGLFRSEFLYLEKNSFPTEEDQFQVYKKVAETMAGKRVIIRTLDIGADKQADYFELEEEENPAMGYRAIRICLEQPDIFKTQLRAIFRASAYGNISIMYPMIISREEIIRIKQIVAEVISELSDLGIPYGKVEQGIMVETPAAAVISDELAKEVDFFSIGTNDLTQYTLAIDRQNTKLDAFYNAHHEAILRLIEMTVENAHKAGIWAGICGELGADTELTERFVKMGIDELSVAPGCILPIRKIIREM